jgi:hypothetical protein
MHALKLVNPNYQATIPPEYHKMHYPSLVKPLYDKMAKGMDENMASYEGKFEKEFNELEFKTLLEEQLSRELCGVTVIKSVEQVQEREDETKRLKGMYEEWRQKWKTTLMKLIEVELQEIKDGKCEFKSKGVTSW